VPGRFGVIQVVAFYLFASVLLVSALLTISSRNPVHSVLWLILAFFNAGGLMLLLGAEFVAMLLVIVYVGAVAVLFLFVVMMLDIDFAEMRSGFVKYLPFGLGLAVVLIGELIVAVGAWQSNPIQRALRGAPTETIALAGRSNTRMIGDLLYTNYIFLFEMAGIILLVAMIGAIVLTNRRRGNVLKQDVAAQNARRPEDATRLVDAPVGKGVVL
jgi:NADH-quinone oxidoreductase subunit J